MSGDEANLRVPACTNCARRKTKCDRNSPCNSCKTSKLQCQYEDKRPDRKRRVLHSSRYEESLAYISNQLEALSNAVHSLVEKNESLSQHGSNSDGLRSTPTNIHAPAESNHANADSKAGNSMYHRSDMSFDPHSKKIADLLSVAASATPSKTTDAHTTAAGTIQTLLEDSQFHITTPAEITARDSSAAFSQYPELSGLKLPPMGYVLQLLEIARTTHQRYFIDVAHVDEEDFSSLCQKVYFPTQPFTIFAWINVNCGLFYLFRDLDKSHYDKLQMGEEQIRTAISVCENNVDQAVGALRLCVDPSFEAASALICAALLKMDGGKGFLAWTLVSTAARMSVDLGYHQLPPGAGNEEKSRQRRLFWLLYSVDRTLAFQFDRSPTIPKYEVSTERPLEFENFRSKWGLTFLEYIDFGDMLAQIYEQLLSAVARREPMPIRIQKAYDLAAMLTNFKDYAMMSLKTQSVADTGLSRDAVQSISIGLSSILTMIYRVLPPNEPVVTATHSHQHDPIHFHSLCVEAGRDTLNSFVNRWDLFSGSQDESATKIFINWTLLFLPFMPYVAVFANQIATGSQDDLVLLRKVLNIIEIAAKPSESSQKAHKAFSVLFKIAEIRSKVRGSEMLNQATATRARTASAIDENLKLSTSSKQSLQHTHDSDSLPAADVATESFFMDWQNPNASLPDWDTVFNEFDLGFGADSAREMMPWFEQYIGDFNKDN